MVARDTPRYAVYFAPDPGSELDTFGTAWLGRDMAGARAEGKSLAPGVSEQRCAELTESPRRYGFHGTLKPPFELNPATTVDALLRTARVFARGLTPVEIPPLELAVIGKFIALTPESQSAALEKLSAACVRAFEAFREPLTLDQIKNYRSNKLTVHQEQMLEHWGYPYVMEEFRFHMSLTDRIDDAEERETIFGALEQLAKPVLSKIIMARHITVFGQTGRNEPMVVIERIPFGRPE
jgi:putative phosphonate metabolism protein